MSQPFRYSMLCLFALCFTPMAVADNHTIESQIPEKILTNKDKQISLVVENDLFGTRGTDQNYTSGVRLSYMDINAPLPNYAEDIARFIPTFDINKTTSVYYSVGQNLYTPDDIEDPNAQNDDRPWAAHLYGSIGMVTITDNHIDEAEVSLGVIGPLALGEETQSFIHENISESPEPLGWDNQLENEPTLALAWQRRWPQMANIDYAGLSTSVTPTIGATLGNVHTHASAGLTAMIVPEEERWQDLPLRVRPAIPGTGFFEIPSEDRWWSWALFAGVEGRAVARNIFLDGNTFRDSASIDKKPLVMDANVGASITLDQYRFSYTVNYRTKEFEGQDSSDVFGAFSVTARF